MRSIPPVLLSKIKEQNQTIWNDANPKMSIQISRAKDTVMDSTYWTVETIREKEGLGDLSITARRFKPYGPPNRLYNIYVDNGVVKTAIREYPDYKKLKWQNQFDVGMGSAVAIAFDGHWERYRKKWQLVTEENPFIFWVDGVGKLWSQLWDDASTLFELASGISKVKAIRAWKNVNFADRDQGIVTGYIKSDGKLYYRNYCTQADGGTTWENERQVIEFTGTAVNLNMFITNDYRMGFIVEDSLGKIHWIITSRNWAGMAIAPEYINARVSGSIELIKIQKLNTYNAEYITASVGGSIEHLYAMSDNLIRHMENISITMLDENEEEYQNWGFRVLVELEHDLTNIDYLDFSLKDENSTSFAVTGVERVGIRQYLFTTADFNNAYGDLTLKFAGSGVTKGEAGQNVDSFSSSFTPTNLVPTFIPLPEVEVIWNE